MSSNLKNLTIREFRTALGYRIHKSIGWGMPWEKFEEHTLLKTTDKFYSISDRLYAKFEDLTDKELTVNDEVLHELKYRGATVRPFGIMQRQLLAKDFATKRTKNIGTGTDLYSIVDVGDNLEHVMFYPNCYYAKRWHRRDDDIDYAFENASNDIDAGMTDFVKYVPFGHYPWTNSLMDSDGEPVAWSYGVKTGDGTYSAVPGEIRWYLTVHDILTNEGVNELRPIVAQWWM